MSHLKNTPLPKILFFTAEPVLALEVKALHLTYPLFNILCKRQFAELKNALENYFYEIVFLDLSYLNDPLGILNTINKLSPATLIFLVDSSGGVDFEILQKITNHTQVYRIFSRPFNFSAHVQDVEHAVQIARSYHKNLYTAAPAPAMVLSDELPTVILLHPDVRFVAKLSQNCEDIAQIVWAANLVDLAILLEKHEPWAIITAARLPTGDGVRACYEIHKKYPDISFGMIATPDDKAAIAAGINYFGLMHVGSEHELLTDIENFLSPLLEGYETTLNSPWKKLFRQATEFPKSTRPSDETTEAFLDRFHLAESFELRD